MKLFTLMMFACLGFTFSCRATKMNSEVEGVNGGEFTALAFARKTPCLQAPTNFKAAPGLPAGPEASLTPGKLCEKGGNRRYKEGILFCERDVDVDDKNRVYAVYHEKGILAATYSNHDDFKIDHFYSLCAGGSNHVQNLWPQHKSIGKYTDPVEPRVCAAMNMGKMQQAEAIEVLKTVKEDVQTAYEICKKLSARIGVPH